MKLSRGIWSGVIATGPMTLAMLEFFNKLPHKERSPLPPAILTREILPVRSKMAERELTWLSHFAFGAMSGAIYSVIESWLGKRSLVKGALFGFFVWGASYRGWIPFFNLRPASRNMPLSRNLMMIVAHVIWGVVLGRAVEDMKGQEARLLEGHRRAPQAE